jgi:Cd2+/Zn2+-exporting ATPase
MRRYAYGGEGTDTHPNHAGSVRLTFKVQGLDCAEEVSTLRRAVAPLVGGEDHLAFDVLNGRMMVLEGAGSVAASDIRQAVAQSGMSAVEWRRGSEDYGATDHRRRLHAWFTLASGAFVAAGIAAHTWLAGSLDEALQLFARHGIEGMPWPELLAYALATALGLVLVLPRAWSSARRLQPDMHLLMTIAVAGAIGIGEWFEAATVSFLFALSLALEGWSVARARRAISALLDLAPLNARLKRADGTEMEVPASEVPVGSHFVVKPGERLPLD